MSLRPVSTSERKDVEMPVAAATSVRARLFDWRRARSRSPSSGCVACKLSGSTDTRRTIRLQHSVSGFQDAGSDRRLASQVFRERIRVSRLPRALTPLEPALTEVWE